MPAIFEKFQKVLNASASCPPSGSSIGVQRGFAHFASTALHATRLMAKATGNRRNSIIRPAWSNTLVPGYLKGWIERPQSICYNTTASGLADGITDREKIRKNSLLSQSDEHYEA